MEQVQTALGNQVKKSQAYARPIAGMSGVDRFIKRVSDIVVSLLGLIILSPLFLIIAILIRLEDGSPVIFRQERIGKGGKPFTIYKFRSMVMSSEQDGKPALCANGDCRLTKVGTFIRNHHLDELPQLWNVLVGDMSMVGYRPERQYFIDKIMKEDSRYSELYAIRPGVFSEATIRNGYTSTMEKMLIRLRMDLDYLYHGTLLTDVCIIFRTAKRIILGTKF